MPLKAILLTSAQGLLSICPLSDCRIHRLSSSLWISSSSSASTSDGVRRKQDQKAGTKQRHAKAAQTRQHRCPDGSPTIADACPPLSASIVLSGCLVVPAVQPRSRSCLP